MHLNASRILLPLFLTLNCCLCSFAQKQSFTGYYITKEGDTVQGRFPRYKQWNNSPEKVNFLPLQTGVSIVLNSVNCNGFHVDNFDTYVSYKGLRLTNPIDFNATTTTSDSDTRDSITAFIRQIASTKDYRFFIYRDQLRINLYYASGNHEITELMQKAALINNVFWQSMTYKRQLEALFANSNQNEKIEDVAYTEESLRSFINSQAGAIPITKNQKNINNGFFVAAGASVNSFKFTEDKALDYTLQSYQTKVVPLVQIGFILALNRNFGRIFFLPQLTVSSFKHSTSTTYNNAYPTFIHTFQSSPVFTLGFHFGYNIINRPGFKLSLMPGGGVTLLSGNKQVDEYRSTATSSRMVITKLETATSSIDIKSMALLDNRYMVWAAYNFPSPVASLATTSGRLTAIQFGVGYKF